MTTRLLLTVAAIAVAGGLVGIPNAYLFNLLSVAAPWALGAATVAYVLPGLVAQMVLRRPGVGILALLLAGLVASPFVPTGIVSVTAYLVLGVLLELPFLVTLYRRWGPAMFWVAGAFVAAVYSLFWGLFYDTPAFGPLVMIGQPVVLLAAMAVAVGLSFLVVRGLRRTGALRGLTPA